MPAPITKCLIEMKTLPEIQWRQTRAVYQNVSLHTCIWQWHFGNRCIYTVFHQSAHKTFLQKGAFLIRYIREQRRHTIHAAIQQPCRKAHKTDLSHYNNVSLLQNTQTHYSMPVIRCQYIFYFKIGESQWLSARLQLLHSCSKPSICHVILHRVSLLLDCVIMGLICTNTESCFQHHAYKKHTQVLWR